MRRLVNGPDAYTPDGNFVLGPAPEVPNFFVASGMNCFGIAGAGALQYIRIGRVTCHGPNIETILQLTKYVGALIDNGDFIGLFARQMICRGRTNLTCAENENLHRA